MDQMKKSFTENKDLFNSPLEVALRLLFIFKSTDKALDQQRLIYYNYLVAHSSDIPNAPKSLHADLPRRSCEILVNRVIIKKGLTLLLSKGLIDVVYSKKGVKYKQNKSTGLLTKYFTSTYSKNLEESAQWLCSEFDSLNEKSLSEFIDKNLGKWGSEFSTELDLGGDVYA